MDDTDRFKMTDPEMDIRRLAKKLFPNLWVHHGVISNVPPAGPMSPARVTDVADRMSAAVLVFSHTLRPVLQYYLEKHSSAMECSKISFWTHLAFLCLRIRLRRDHLLDYFLNATAVVTECARCCGGRLDDVHAWSATFFCAFFEHELIGPFYSAGGWAGLMNYIQESNLHGIFERLVPCSLVAVASESLSAQRRERITAARSLRGDEIERFEPAKILAAKIFHWDFSEKFPMSPLAPGSFKRTPNIRRRKARSKSESAHTKMRMCYIDVEPCAASSAPNLRYIDAAKPESKRVHTLRSISIDVKATLSDQKGPYIPLTLQSELRNKASPRVENKTSSVVEESEATSILDLQRSPDSTSSSSSVYEPICSPKTSFNNMKLEFPSRMLPKSLFPISMDENQTTENLLTLEKSKEVSLVVDEHSGRKRFSLPNSNRRTLIDTMQEKNPSVFQAFIWKDDFTLRKSKITKSLLSEENDDDKIQVNSQNKNCSFSFEDIHNTYTNEPIRRNSKAYHCTHWRTSYESMASVETDASSNTSLGNSINHWTDDSKSETDDIGKLVAKLLLTNVTDDPYRNEDDNKMGAFSFNKNKQIYAKSSDMNATTLKSSYRAFEEEDTESMLSTSSSGIGNDFRQYKMSQNRIHSNSTGSYSSLSSFSSILKRSEFKSADDPRTSEREDGKSLSDEVKTRPKTELSPSSSSSDKSDNDDRVEKVVVQPDTQTVLYKKRLLGSLAKRVDKARGDNQSETPEKRKMDPNLDSRIPHKKEKDSKKISDIQRALKNSGVPNPVVFKI